MLLPRVALRGALRARPWRAVGLCWKHVSSLKVANEPILAFTQGSPERDALQKALKELKGRTEAIPCVVGDEEVWTSDVQYQVSPFNHGHKVAKFCYADKALLHRAIEAALAARKEWDLKPVADRAQVFLKAADMLSGPRRAEILAKTMVGQGFVAAISPFNFTAIGGNLAGAPALMGNVVLWKPSDTAMLASYAVYRILREAGLPPNIIQFVPADGPTFGDTVTSSEHLCGINFTGSVPIWALQGQVFGSFSRIRKWLEHAHSSPSLTVLAGGQCDDSVGYFVEPCIIESKDPQDPIMKEEIFGPVLTVYVYPDDKYKETLRLVDSTTSYGLTGAVFAQDKDVVREATEMLRNAAGNFYINDKSTGSVSRCIFLEINRAVFSTGTNDKPGGPHYILRWTSPQVIKETHKPLGDWRYPYMQ
ncbi:hypothetical protein E2I00_019847 [Balaenoptera physalus]|uniref:Aldehyde dehydrogenase domain-containing protein n=1 Tax=Balaenoptera physalus TaxID=9770 RepID=A0A643C918_BALPH|nr:hypothetical protein E2I00_019847 [Balaenoptera physalus]